MAWKSTEQDSSLCGVAVDIRCVNRLESDFECGSNAVEWNISGCLVYLVVLVLGAEGVIYSGLEIISIRYWWELSFFAGLLRDFYWVKKWFKRRKIPMDRDDGKVIWCFCCLVGVLGSLWLLQCYFWLGDGFGGVRIVNFTNWNSPDFRGNGRNSDEQRILWEKLGNGGIWNSVFERKSADSFHGFRLFPVGKRWNWQEITGNFESWIRWPYSVDFQRFSFGIRWIPDWIRVLFPSEFRPEYGLFPKFFRATDLSGCDRILFMFSGRNTASTFRVFFRQFPAGKTPEPAGIDRKKHGFRQVPAGSGGRNHRPG